MNARHQHDQTTQQKLQIKHVLQRENRNLDFWTFTSRLQFDLIDGGMRSMNAHKGQELADHSKLSVLESSFICSYTYTIDQSIRPLNQSINRSGNQSVDQSINRSINQSIDRLINMLHKSKVAAER